MDKLTEVQFLTLLIAIKQNFAIMKGTLKTMIVTIASITISAIIIIALVSAAGHLDINAVSITNVVIIIFSGALCWHIGDKTETLTEKEAVCIKDLNEVFEKGGSLQEKESLKKFFPPK